MNARAAPALIRTRSMAGSGARLDVSSSSMISCASITTCAVSGSQASAMVPTLKSSLTGTSRGLVVGQVGGRHGGHVRGAPAAAQHLVEQLVQPVGQRGDLELLQRHRGQSALASGLQKEGS